MEANKMKMRGVSLNPTPSARFHMMLRMKHKDFNRRQKASGGMQMSFRAWCYNKNIDLSGKSFVDIDQKVS